VKELLKSDITCQSYAQMKGSSFLTHSVLGLTRWIITIRYNRMILCAARNQKLTKRELKINNARKAKCWLLQL